MLFFNTMKIQVLGSGCQKCKNLYDLVNLCVEELKMEQEIEYITDINKLIEEGLAASPAVKINDVIVCAGIIPTKEQIKEWILNPPTDEMNMNDN